MVDDDLVAVLEEALRGLPPDGSALRARLLVRLAVALYYSDAAQRREDLVQEALGIARGLDDPPTLAYVLDQGQIATNGPDTAERGLAWAHELFALADAANDQELSVRARSWQIDLLLELDDLAGADMAIEALDRIATDSRDPRARAYIPLHRARRAMIAGQLDDTEVLIHEGIQLGWSLQDSTVPILAGAQLFWLRMGQGRLRELEDAVRQFADQLPGDARVARRARHAVPAHRAPRGGAPRVRPPRRARLRDDPARQRLVDGHRDAGRAERDLPRRGALAPARGAAGAARRAQRRDPDRDLRRPGQPLPRPHRRRARRPRDGARPPAEAREACERMGYKPMLAVLDVDEARMLARRNEPGDVERARELLQRGLARAEEVGVPRLDERLARAAALLPTHDGGPTAAEPAQGPASAVLAREGDVWRLDYEGRVLRVRDAKGMRHLALLLANPGVEFHAVDVATAAEGGAAPPSESAEGLAVRAGTGDAGPALDSQAKAEYRSRLEDLRAEIEEAESFNDPERAARAREEMDFIAHELSAAVGLGGRDRKVASAAERARVNVTRALRREIRRIADEDAGLGRELETTVRTGTFCAYEPDPRRPVAWEVDAG